MENYPIEEMAIMAVGQKWNYMEVPSQEGAWFETRENGPLLLLAFDSPNESEIKDAKEGKVQMGYYVRGSVMFIVFKIGSMPWMDAPFNIRLYDKYGMDLSWIDELDSYKKNEGIAIQIYLIDIRTEILHTIRFISASHKFTLGFRDEIKLQQMQEFSVLDYWRTINEVYSSLTTKDIAKRSLNMFSIPAR